MALTAQDLDSIKGIVSATEGRLMAHMTAEIDRSTDEISVVMRESQGVIEEVMNQRFDTIERHLGKENRPWE